jgi:predicted amidohydrolase
MSPVQYKIALCQLQVTPDKDANIAHARARIEAAAAAGAKLVILPVSPSLLLPVCYFRFATKLQEAKA